MITKIFIASDHAGVDLKGKIVKAFFDKSFLKDIMFEVHDLGPQSTDSVDYPDYADRVCQKIHGFSLVQVEPEKMVHLPEIGILICGSGQGMTMRANKWPQVRAALCYSEEIAKLSREHNNANVICLGSRFVSIEQALKMIEIFVKTPFAGGRHSQRVVKINSTPR
jgi:ribose 5-phosphate isomerase B